MPTRFDPRPDPRPDARPHRRPRRRALAWAFLAAVLLLAGCSRNVVEGPPQVLYFYDSFFVQGQDPYVLDALFDAGYLVRRTNDVEVFDAELRRGRADLVVALVQSDGTTALPLDAAAFERYLGRGGRVLLVDWRRDPTLARVLDARYTGETNLRVAHLDDPHLADGVGDRVVLREPGWLTYSMGLRPIEGGVAACAFENDDACLVLGNGGRSALLGMLGDTLPDDVGATFFANLARHLLRDPGRP